MFRNPLFAGKTLKNELLNTRPHPLIFARKTLTIDKSPRRESEFLNAPIYGWQKTVLADQNPMIRSVAQMNWLRPLPPS